MTDSTTRLHISPLTPALLDSILVPSIRPSATNISFHTIPTFPENNYGFVSLPSMEADKLKKKLNGSILKGKKLKVEVARADPSKKEAKVEGKSSEEAHSSKPTKTAKRKADDNTLDGYELPADRQVKRGWTEPASAKRLKKHSKTQKEDKKTKLQTKSKYTEKAECLFKTKTPPNKTPDQSSKKTSKSKKSTTPNEVVVHEFSQTVSHPSFIKSTTGGKPVTAGFEEGKGWIDEDGNVQELDNQKRRTAAYHPGKRDGAKERVLVKKAIKERKKMAPPAAAEASESAAEKEEQDSDWTSSSGSSDNASSSSESDAERDNDSETSSSSGMSSISVGEKENTDTQPGTPAAKGKAAAGINRVLKAENSSNSKDEDGRYNQTGSDAEIDDISQVDSTSKLPVGLTSEIKDVHPLEALFKRTHPGEGVPSSDTGKAFSFFTADNDDIEEEEEEVQPESFEPLTPYTQRDRQVRGMRSGAPTPDTAAIIHHQNISQVESDADEDMDDAEDDYAHNQAAETTPSKIQSRTSSQQQPEESDFVKWFWEHRGENNRAWKRRRREAAKEKRQRENRRKGLKGRG